MFYFTFLLRLLYFWETLNSFAYAQRFSIEEAIRLHLIKSPPGEKNTKIPPNKRNSNNQTLTYSSANFVGIIALFLIILLIFKTSQSRKRLFMNTKQY